MVLFGLLCGISPPWPRPGSSGKLEKLVFPVYLPHCSKPQYELPWWVLRSLLVRTTLEKNNARRMESPYEGLGAPQTSLGKPQ